MAEFSVSGLDEMEALILQRSEAVDAIAPEMLAAGAKILAAAQKSELQRVSRGDRSIGTLANSIGIGSVKRSADGLKVYINVYPQGDQPHGTPRRGKRGNVSNAQVGFMWEYGKAGKFPARPWVGAAMARCAAQVQEAMRGIWEAKQNG